MNLYLFSIIVLKNTSFSGPVAGAGYSYLKNGNFKTIFILGPSHHVYLRLPPLIL